MGQQILIVDDVDFNLVLFKTLIQQNSNAQIYMFSSPQAGLAWAAENETDLVIVDYMMPEMHGVDFILAFRQLPGKETTPILMVTANGQKEVCYEALGAGATDFLTKPVDKVEFQARIKNMLTLSDAQKKLADHSTWLAEEVRRATLEILDRERETVVRLTRAAEYRDPDTGAHILRMAHYSALIARELGLSVFDQTLLLEAAPMHDIGKVGIPDAILLKPDRLTENEMSVMRAHPLLGYKLLNGSSSKVLQTGADIALGHHEKFDGSGYPAGLVGDAIPIFSRIVAVADVFDALTSERPYKKAWTLEQSIGFLKANSGSHFDPACVDAFLVDWEAVLAIKKRFHDEDDSAFDHSSSLKK
jgi:putative two-component system response regulator